MQNYLSMNNESLNNIYESIFDANHAILEFCKLFAILDPSNGFLISWFVVGY